MKKPSWNEDSALRSAWRRIFTRSPIVIEIIKEGTRKVPRICKDGSRGKVDSKEIHCQVCDKYVKASLNGKNNIQVDHVIPVIPVNELQHKIQDWNVFKSRLFCEKSNLQRICTDCHRSKTQKERVARQAGRDLVELTKIEERLKSVWTLDEEKQLKKQISKFLTKKKAPETKERALKLREILTNKIEKED